jgi:hypothetical protein
VLISSSDCDPGVRCRSLPSPIIPDIRIMRTLSGAGAGTRLQSAPLLKGAHRGRYDCAKTSEMLAALDPDFTIDEKSRHIID